MWAPGVPGKLLATLIIALTQYNNSRAQTCTNPTPVGLADSSIIPSDRIVTSSQLKGHDKEQIRYNCCNGTYGKAWCPDTSKDKISYVEIQLPKAVAFAGLVIQPPTTINNESHNYPENFMKTFDLLFKLPGLQDLVIVAQNIDAIVNKSISAAEVTLKQAIVTDLIRIQTRLSENLPCFRMELYECDITSLCLEDYCLNSGTCSGPNICKCSASYFGERCQYSKQAIPVTVFEFLKIVDNTIVTTSQNLTAHGDVTLDIDNSVVVKNGGYVEFSSLSTDSCFLDLDKCLSGFTLTLTFSFSKMDAGTNIVLTNGAGINTDTKGITLLFYKGELHCNVVTSTLSWMVTTGFSLVQLKWYQITISWSPDQGLLVLQGRSLVGSSFMPQTLSTLVTKTNMFTIGSNEFSSVSELHWKACTTIPLFWQEVKRAGLLTDTTTTSVTTTTSTTADYTTITPQTAACSSLTPVGMTDSNIISGSRIVTSSELFGHEKDQIRLNCCEGTFGRAWCPDITRDKNPYVEIHLEKLVAFAGLSIQAPTTLNNEIFQYPVNFMKTFDLLFRLQGLEDLVTVAQDIEAIVNSSVILSTVSLKQAIVTDLIRIETRQSENLPCFRMELYTCEITSLCPEKYCQNNGTCSGPKTCNCSDSFFGDKCQYTKQTIPVTVYKFLEIIANTILTETQNLTFYGDVTLDVENSLIVKTGSYIELGSLYTSSCFSDLDKCFSGFTVTLTFSFSKIDTNTNIVLTNGAGMSDDTKGITLLFNKGQLHCNVVTSTLSWTVRTSFTLVQLKWYEITISWSPDQGLLVLQGSSLVGSSFMPQTNHIAVTKTNMFTIGSKIFETMAELRWKTCTTISLFWQEVKRAGLLTDSSTTTTSVKAITTKSATADYTTVTPAVTTPQVTACSSLTAVGLSDSNIISDSRIVASSEMEGHTKDEIRFNCCEGTYGNAWCPDITIDKNPYVEIHLERPVAFAGLSIQAPTTINNEMFQYPENFLKTFDLLFKLPGLEELVTVAQDIEAIVNKSVKLSSVSLKQAIVTDLIRIETRQSENLPCFRMELYTCEITSLCPENFCLNNGACSGSKTCNCSDSFFGDRCQYTKLTIPVTVYKFLQIVANTIITETQNLTFHGDVTLDINNSLIVKTGGYIELSSLSTSSCFSDLDNCFSGFTITLTFSFSKIDTNTNIVLTNGAGISDDTKGITLLFNRGQLHCNVVTSTLSWTVRTSFTLVQLKWYEITISWSPDQGLLVLQGSSLIGSSFMPQTNHIAVTKTNMFTIGSKIFETMAELRWKTCTTISLFWQEVKRAGLLIDSSTTTTSVKTTDATSTEAVTIPQTAACPFLTPVGLGDPNIISSSRIVTSSEMEGHKKDEIRLDCCEGTYGNAWCPDISMDKSPYVEIHLEKPVAFAGISIQAPTTINNEIFQYPENFLKTFDLLFKLSGLEELVTVAQDIEAIVNKSVTLSTVTLKQAIITDLIRIETRQSENLPCFRMELYTCEITSLCPENYCLNNGICSGPKTCNCSDSYFGDRCQYTMQTIPVTVYKFLQIVANTIITETQNLTFHGDVTLDIDKSLIVKTGGYIELSSLSTSSCFSDLDKCFSGFTITLTFSFSKIDTNTNVVLTNGAGISDDTKGITLLFNKGQLRCNVVTSTLSWTVRTSFTLVQLKWYEITVSWSPDQGLLILQGSSLVGSSFMPQTNHIAVTKTNMFTIGSKIFETMAELRWKTFTTISLFWQEVKRAGLFTDSSTTTTSVKITATAPTPAASSTVTAAVTTPQTTACSSLTPVGLGDSNIISGNKIVTSSELFGHEKDKIRLDCCEGTYGKAWCPDMTKDKSPYVEIHLEKPVAFAGLSIQAPTTLNNEMFQFPENFLKTFDLLFKLPGLEELVTVAQDIEAIVNKSITISTVSLKQAIVTDLIRIETRQSENLPCFRMELYACDIKSLCPENYCQNNGACSGPRTCNCSDSFFGDRCQYTKQTIPVTVYKFLQIIANTIITETQNLTFHGDVTLDIDKSLIVKTGGYIDLSSLSTSSCFSDLDKCFSGFTITLTFSFSKIDTNTNVVLTNGAGISEDTKGITLLFNKGELHCNVVTSTLSWTVRTSFTLVQLKWYEITVSWSPDQGLLILQGSSLVGSSFMPQTNHITVTKTNMFTIGSKIFETMAELRWKTCTTISLFWKEVKRAGLLTDSSTTTTSVKITATAPTPAASSTVTAAVTTPQMTACSTLTPVGLGDSNIILDNRIVTSSELFGHEKDKIRLDCCEGTYGKAWCPDMTKDKNPYVEIHLEKPVAFAGLSIQAPTTLNNEMFQFPENFLKTFDLLFKLPGLEELVTVAKDIEAIVNKSITISTVSLKQAIVTDLIRIETRQSENLPCFRMELYACDIKSLCPENYCQNNGACSGPRTCNCSDSFFGDRCQYTKQTIPVTVYKFLQIIANTIITETQNLTFHGDVTLDIDKSLIVKTGGYIDLSSLSTSSCFSDLDKCFSGFTITLTFSFSKIDTNTNVVLTNGAGISEDTKGITLLFNKGELHCNVVTSTLSWTVRTSFTLVQLKWYEITVSWSPDQGLLILQGSSLVGSSFMPQTNHITVTKTNMFTIGSKIFETMAELRWKTCTTISLFWKEVKRAGLLTDSSTTTTSVKITATAPTPAASSTVTAAVTTPQMTACSTLTPVGLGDSNIILDNRIVTSSELFGHEKDKIRLDCCEGTYGKAWCPDMTKDKSPYVEIHLEKPVAFAGLSIQAPTTLNNEMFQFPENFLKTFDLLFKLPGLEELVTVAKDIEAIVNKSITISTVSLKQAIVTDLIRIETRQSENLPCFRMELYACDIKSLCPENYCQNNGACSGPRTCNCSDSFFGDRCQYTKQTIPVTVYKFLQIIANTIITETQNLTFHGDVTLDIDKSLIVKTGGYIDLSSLSTSSCFSDLDKCFSGFTITLTFSFSKIDTNTNVVLTNGAGISEDTKGITLLFNKGELHCNVVTSTLSWTVRTSFTLVQLKWYEITVSWSPDQGLLILQGSSLVGSSFMPQTNHITVTKTNMFTIGSKIFETMAELRWKTCTTISLFWKEVKRAGLLTDSSTTTTSVKITATAPTPAASSTVTAAVTTPQMTACSTLTPVGLGDSNIILDNRIVTSSELFGHEKDKIRLDCCEGTYGKAWCPDMTKDKSPYVEIHLEKPVAFAGLSIQAPTTLNNEMFQFPENFLKTFDLLFKLPGLEELVTVAKDIEAIVNKSITISTVSLKQAIVTDLIRIETRQSENLPCFRMELYACDIKSLCPENYCQNNGACSGPRTCNCSDSFFGDRCQYTKQTIPVTVYKFLQIIANTIVTETQNLTFHGDVTLDIDNSLIIKPGSSIELSSLTTSSCFSDLDKCSSGFTITLTFSFSKIDTNANVVLTNGAGNDDTIKGITFLFSHGELHCYVATSTLSWVVRKSFTLVQLTWYDITISWSPYHGLLVLHGNSLVGSSFMPQIIPIPATKTNIFTIGSTEITTTTELHWKACSTIALFLQDVKRAGLFTDAGTTTTSVASTTISPTATTSKATVCNRELGMKDGSIAASQITASSSIDGHGTEKARPGCCKNQEDGAWCAKPTDDHPWIQVDLAEPTALSAVHFQLTENTNNSIAPQNYVQVVMVKYRDVISGSTGLDLYSESVLVTEDATVVYTAILQPPIVTDSLRMLISKYVGNACFQFELIGCDTTDLCPPDFCENSGQCVGNNRCLCEEGFYGERCQLTEINHKEIEFHDIINNTITTTDTSITLTAVGNVTLIKVDHIKVIQLTSGGTVTFPEDKCLQNLDKCSSGFTISFVVNLVNITDDKIVISTSGGHKDNTQGLTLLYNRLEHTLTFTVATRIYFWTISSTFKWQENTWYQLVITWHPSAGIKLVVDDVLIGSVVGGHISKPADKTDLLCFGCSFVNIKTTSTILIRTIIKFNVFITDLIRAHLISLSTTKRPNATPTSPSNVVDHFWNLKNISETVTISLDWKLVLIGNPTRGVDGIVLIGNNQHIEIPDQNNTCLTNPTLCTDGLTIDIRIKFTTLEEDTIIFTTGGENPDYPGVTLLYRFGYLHAIVRTTSFSWYVSVPRKIIWTKDFCDILVSWSQQTTLKLVINKAVIVESEGPVPHTDITLTVFNSLIIGGGNINFVISQLHVWLVDVDSLTRLGLLPCIICPGKPTTTKTTLGTTLSTIKDSTSFENQCPEGCIPSEICFGGLTTHAEPEITTSSSKPCIISDVPPSSAPTQPSSPPATERSTTPSPSLPPICPTRPPAAGGSTTQKPSTPPICPPRPSLPPTTDDGLPPICPNPSCAQTTSPKPPPTRESTTSRNYQNTESPSPPETSTNIPATPKPSSPPATEGVTTPKPSSPPATEELTTPKCTSPACTGQITPKPSSPPATEGVTTPKPSSPPATEELTTPKCTSPACTGQTTPKPSSPPATEGVTTPKPSSPPATEELTTPKCTSPACTGQTTPKPSSPPATEGVTTPKPSSPPATEELTTPKCTSPACTGQTTPQPSSPPATEGVTTPKPSSPPATEELTTPKCTSPACTGQTTPKPSSPPATEGVTTPKPSSPPATEELTTPKCTSPACTGQITPQPSSPPVTSTNAPTTPTPIALTAAPTTAAPTTQNTTRSTTTRRTDLTTKQSCPPQTSSVTLTPEVNSNGQGQLTCSVANPPEPGITIRFTWSIEGETRTWNKIIESPDRSATISVTEIQTSILNKRITCTAEVQYMVANAEWCWPVHSNIVVPSIKCPPINGTIKVIEGREEQLLQVQITVPPSLLCKAEDNGQCRVEVTTTIVKTLTNEIKCSLTEIIPQAVLGVTTIGSSASLSCGIAITPANWQNAVTIPIKATLDGIKDGVRNRKLQISVRIVGQVTLQTSVEHCGDISIEVVDRDEVSTCSSVNDPHIKTFDDFRYNNFIKGEFTLYQHVSKESEVRALYEPCITRLPNGPTCNCGAAVRSGDDVITFDTCNTRQNKLSILGNSLITVDMYKNGQLTPGTRVLRIGCGQKYEVYLPSGTKVIVTATRKPFMNINIQASSYDFEKTEGLCGSYNKNPTDDLNGYKVTDDFNKIWKTATTIFKGVPAFTTPAQKTYCSCLTGQQPVCRQGLDFYVCGAGTVASNDITAVLVSQAKTPVTIGQAKTLAAQVHIRRRRAANDTASVQDAAEFISQTNYTTESATQYCQSYLENVTAVQSCLNNLKDDALNASIQNCAEDVMVLNDPVWATSHVDDIINECLADANTNVNAWENNTNTDGPNLPDYINADLCVETCTEHGSCVKGVCDCEKGWTGETCQIGQTSIPNVLPALESCNVLQSPCLGVPIDGNNFVFSKNLMCKFRYIRIGKNVTVTAEEYTVPAEPISIAQVVCPQAVSLSPIGRSALIAISNDGVTYSNDSYIHIVQKSSCQTCSVSEDLLKVSCTWKPGSCIIDNQCYARYELFKDDECYRCDPDVSIDKWTRTSGPNCSATAEPIAAASGDTSSDDDTAIIVLGVLCGVLALVTVGVTIGICRARANRKTEMEGLLNRQGSFDIYRSNALAPTSADLTGQSQAAKINAFYNPPLSS